MHPYTLSNGMSIWPRIRKTFFKLTKDCRFFFRNEKLQTTYMKSSFKINFWKVDLLLVFLSNWPWVKSSVNYNLPKQWKTCHWSRNCDWEVISHNKLLISDHFDIICTNLLIYLTRTCNLINSNQSIKYKLTCYSLWIFNFKTSKFESCLFYIIFV